MHTLAKRCLTRRGFAGYADEPKLNLLNQMVRLKDWYTLKQNLPEGNSARVAKCYPLHQRRTWPLAVPRRRRLGVIDQDCPAGWRDKDLEWYDKVNTSDTEHLRHMSFLVPVDSVFEVEHLVEDQNRWGN